MKTQQSGFTLIEMVIVIVILGIMAAVAIPKFTDLTTDAANAAAQGVAGALASASAANYGVEVAKNTAQTITGLTVANVCTAPLLTQLISGSTIVSGTPANNNEFKVGGTGICTSVPGTSVTCTVQGKNGAAQNATIICGKF